MKLDETKAGVLLNYLSIFFSLATGMLLTPILVRNLGKADYGLYQLIGSFVAYLSVLDLGFGATTTRYISRYNALKDEKSKANLLALFFLIYGIISILTLIAGATLYCQLENFFGGTLSAIEFQKAKKMVLLLVGSMAITIFGSLFTGALDGHEKFIFPRLANIVKSLLNIILGIIIVTHGSDSVGLTWLNVVLNIGIFFILALYAVKVLKLELRFYSFNKYLLKEVATYSFFIFLQSMMSLLYWRIGGVVLGVMVGTSSVAIFALAIQINHIFLYSTTSISDVLLPTASKMATKNATGEELTDFMVTPARYSLMVYALLSVGFIFVGKDFIYLWVGDGFENIYYIVVMVVLAGMVPRLQNAGTQIARAYNMQRFFTAMYFFMGLLNIILTIVLVHIWSEIGAALATAIALILGNTISANFFYSSYLRINVTRYFKDTFSGIHWAIIAAIIDGFLLDHFWPRTSMLCSFVSRAFLITIVYLVVLIRFGLRANERSMLQKIFPIMKAL